MTQDGRMRVYIFHVVPTIDGGRYPIKRIIGDTVSVEADLVADGHDIVGGRLGYRRVPNTSWSYVPLQALDNDRYRAEFDVRELGLYEYVVEGWIDEFLSWGQRFNKKLSLNQDIDVELQIGREIVGKRLALYSRPYQDSAPVVHTIKELESWINRFDRAPRDECESLLRSSRLEEIMRSCPDVSHIASSRIFSVRVDRERAGFGAWYEFFPRSCPSRKGSHGTLRECEDFLSYVADLGFDVVYLPPIHPIGLKHRKGSNNHTVASPGDPGSPWAIGGPEGGHTAIHPQLGTLEDFDHFVQRVNTLNMELALDLTFQCSPDHPWVVEHPEWFRHFPDGSIQYAENPPKKYEDVFPLNFDCEDWPALWQALLDVTIFWAERGVRIFRVDNPHTKPLPFWEWFISQMKDRFPDVIFLSEAFTRPKLMEALSKLGFSQSYTYFAWRNTAQELRDYVSELVFGDKKEYFRPSFWPNTPDILTSYLQTGLPSAFTVRFILAATLSPNYGIYGPAFELLEHEPLFVGGEEYNHSEKYEVRSWDLSREPNIQNIIRKVNGIRHHEAALKHGSVLAFHQIDNPQILVYSKRDQNNESVLLMVINLDPMYTQSGWTALDMRALGLKEDAHFVVHDLLTGARYAWQGPYNYVELRPDGYNAHLLRIEEGI
ncbi:MAG: alpha-1,4-glucan--maltose-1-phosphate maltosyltransferase [Firmicutes bacterium]|jgi:starch synthase (maltosyl-transferring)|nr:alpha-1,4-glucan--maltose-1-phosphate maltosyltransferase [Bacillota bacterium]MCL5014353.1 alpha-1,4-glucan--maltose-1-phosphate maltosyltransferase [Bacillota bacterium]